MGGRETWCCSRRNRFEVLPFDAPRQIQATAKVYLPGGSASQRRHRQNPEARAARSSASRLSSRLNSMPDALSNLLTEQPNPASARIDKLPTEEVLKTINDEDRCVAESITPEIPQIAKAVDAIV